MLEARPDGDRSMVRSRVALRIRFFGRRAPAGTEAGRYGRCILRSDTARPGSVLVLLLLAGTLLAAQTPGPPLGREVSSKEIAAWDLAVAADGTGLPPGAGDAGRGEGIYFERCLSCHGPEGRGAANDPLVGGIGSLKTATPLKTVTSYWPYAPTLFDYIRRAMPFDQPGTLSDEQVYSVVAYLLALEGLIDRQEILDAESLARIRMPNREGFIGDPRPDVPSP